MSTNFRYLKKKKLLYAQITTILFKIEKYAIIFYLNKNANEA